ncbi:17290_t:CDS:2 [Acaulospora colombiana]|uniref:17290_t:CDS:1 n=1 Tax=Acaulospora colombiana TaxID=27376 RepID=A0ACA9N946_9GLOM|nr:17290_t:CDS:2 [Acaulospora colombiana]
MNEERLSESVEHGERESTKKAFYNMGNGLGGKGALNDDSTVRESQRETVQSSSQRTSP